MKVIYIFINERRICVKCVILDMEVRDVIFHPYLPLIFSCSDGKLSIDSFSK